MNHEVVIYNFRKELVERLLEEGFNVVISSPPGKKIDRLIEIGCTHVNLDINRHGMNPLEELKLLNYYYRIINDIKPDIVLSYTIKPNIYGGLAAQKYKIPYLVNITGLGNAIENNKLLQKPFVFLYKKAFYKVDKIYFQNRTNMKFFIDNDIVTNRHELLPGSGVNLKHFQTLEYPDDKEVNFVFISRVMKAKGIEEYLAAASYIKDKYPFTNFHVCGFIEESYTDILQEFQEKDIIYYHGMVDDIREVLNEMHCTIHPSYHEGMSNILLESAASARPVLASNIPGCQETFDDNITGFGFEAQNSSSLIETIEKFLNLSHEEKRIMGLKGRKKVEKQFSRTIVVDTYMNEINKILEEK